MSSRIYAVHDTRANPLAIRLVRATNKAQAIRHVAADWIAADVATQEALVAQISRGTVVEDAGADLPAVEAA